MTGERTYPVLSVPDLDEAIDFYAVLGFARSYRQLRPNPYAVVGLEDMAIHLSGIDGYDPETSVGSVIISVPDAEALYASFADRLRTRYGKLPSAGIPRILRPRRKQGTATGFTIVDPGGNWLRFFRSDATEDEARGEGLTRVMEVAARQGDAHGDDARALEILDRGLERYSDASPVERVRALLYRAELLVRLDQPDAARATVGEASRLVTADNIAELAADLAHARDVIG
jgi:catechol 2,3-dioxygenase-like lactoylglutathione lyase family enzyme